MITSNVRNPKKPGAGGRSLARATPVSAAERDKMTRLHGEGLNCRQIAREIGRTAATVSKHAREMGLSFDRSKTIAATSARRADLAAQRAEVSAEFLTITQAINARVMALLAKPGDIAKPWGLRDLAIASGMYFDRHMQQDTHDAERERDNSDVDRWLEAMTGQQPPPSESAADDTAKARSVLGGLFESLTEAYEADPETGQDWGGTAGTS